MIECCGFSYKCFKFPCGEKHVVLNDIQELPNLLNVTLYYNSDEDIIELLLLNDAIKQIGGHIDQLHIPYVPYSRQDRVSVPGECLSIKVFCDLINTIKANTVVIEDPHSDVTSSLLNNVVVIHQHEIFQTYAYRGDPYYLVSPDGGALKKTYKLAAVMGSQILGVIECSKKRDVKTGEISGIRVNYDEIIHDKDFCIVDDICDGGRTFIEIAKALQKFQPRKIILMVTHGFFTKGLEVFDGLIDEIYTMKGRVK